MAGASRRTSICLTAVAIVFIIVIIILCVIPDPCRDRDPRPECRITGSGRSGTDTPKDVITDDVSTPSSSTLTSTSSTEATSTRRARTSTESSTSSVGSSTKSSSTTRATTDDYEDYDDDEDSTTATTSGVDNATTSDVDNATTSDVDNATTSEVDNATTSDVDNATTSDMDYATTSDMDNATTSDMDSTTTTSGVDNGTTSEPSDTDGTTETPEMAETDYEEATNTTSTTDDYDTTNTTEASTTSGYETEDANSTESANTTDGTTLEVTNSTIEETETTSTTTLAPTTTAATTTVGSTTPEIPPIMISDGVCDTKACKEVAARMLDIMDHGNVDPCQDFYQYSCGGVLDDLFLKPENAQLPANILIKKALAKADRNDTDLKELLVVYDSCLNYSRSHTQEDRIREIRKVFESLGYEFDPKALEKVDPYDHHDFDLSVVLARMMKKHFTPFFDFMIDVDDKHPTQLIYKMTLPAFTSPFTQNPAKQVCHSKYKKKADEARLKGEVFNITKHYADYVNCTTVGVGLAARLDRMSEGVNALNLTSHIANSTYRSQLISGARMNVDIMLKRIAEILPSPPEMRKKTLKKEFDRVTLRELDDGTVFTNSPINFETFFKELAGKPLNIDNTFIQVYFKDTLKSIFEIMDEELSESRMAQNMMLFLWTERVYGDLVKPIGPEPGSQEYCFNAVSSLMDDYVTYLYLRELPQREELSGQMSHMIRHFKEQVKNQVELLSVDLQDKVDSMTGEVARLEEARKVIRNNINKMSVINNDFVRNYQNLMEHYRERLYGLQDKYPYEHDALWSLIQFAYKASGVTSYALNKFLIPHAAMNPPYYYGNEVPAYINYAGIGHMIAHELMHGFDSTGIEFSDSGRSKPTPMNRVVSQTECLGEELTATFSRNSSSGMRYVYTLHPDLSLNELLADSAATKLAWDTYKKELAAASMGYISTTTQPYRTLPPSRRRRREVEDLSYAIEGLRSRAKRQASMPVLPDDFEGTPLPFLTNFTALQLYFIKTAQNQCSATSEINIVDVMEKEHLPPNLRINLMIRHDPLFAKAFNCPVSSYMGPKFPSCQFDPLGSDALTVT